MSAAKLAKLFHLPDKLAGFSTDQRRELFHVKQFELLITFKELFTTKSTDQGRYRRHKEIADQIVSREKISHWPAAPFSNDVFSQVRKRRLLRSPRLAPCAAL